MKKKIIALITTATLLCTMAGCGNSNTSSTENSLSTTQSSESAPKPTPAQKTLKQPVVEYNNLPLCANDKIEVNLDAISKKGITLNIKNNSAETLTISYGGLALDGRCLIENDYALLHEDLIPNTTTNVLIPYALDEAEHQTISGSFEILHIDSEGYGYTDSYLSFSNIDLGQAASQIWGDSPYAQTLYEDARVSCSYYQLTDSLFVVRMLNKSNQNFQASFDSIAINGQTITETSCNGSKLLPGCESLVYVETLDYDLESNVKSGDNISGIIHLFDQNGGGLDGQFSFNMTMQ